MRWKRFTAVQTLHTWNAGTEGDRRGTEGDRRGTEGGKEGAEGEGGRAPAGGPAGEAGAAGPDELLQQVGVSRPGPPPPPLEGPHPHLCVTRK